MGMPNPRTEILTWWWLSIVPTQDTAESDGNVQVKYWTNWKLAVVSHFIFQEKKQNKQKCQTSVGTRPTLASLQTPQFVKCVCALKFKANPWWSFVHAWGVLGPTYCPISVAVCVAACVPKEMYACARVLIVNVCSPWWALLRVPASSSLSLISSRFPSSRFSPHEHTFTTARYKIWWFLHWHSHSLKMFHGLVRWTVVPF